MDKMCFWQAIFQNFTKWYFLRPERGILGPKIWWEKEIGYFTSFSSKKGKKKRRLDFSENLDFEVFRRFLTKIQIYPFFVPFLPFFCWGCGLPSIVFGLFLPINGFKIDSKEKKDQGLEYFVPKIWTKCSSGSQFFKISQNGTFWDQKMAF